MATAKGHISSLTAVMFSDLSMTNYPVTNSDWDTAFSNPLTVEDKLGKLFDNKSKLVTIDADTIPGGVSFADLIDTTNDVVPGSVASSAEFVRITHLKEFPALGTPANITKVPEYGSKTSKQVQGQADLPNMEITLNYIPSLWANAYVHDEEGNIRQPRVGDGKTYVFRFTLLGTEPSGYTTSELRDSEHSCFYFLGKVEAIEVTSSLTEAMTAKLTISVQSEIKGAYTAA
jgi:hypothetical protein